MFSMGYRRAKPTQGNTNFQKDFFWQTTSGSLPAGLKKVTDAMVTKSCQLADLQFSLFTETQPWVSKFVSFCCVAIFPGT